jgi:hypothetical protein
MDNFIIYNEIVHCFWDRVAPHFRKYGNVKYCLMRQCRVNVALSELSELYLTQCIELTLKASEMYNFHLPSDTLLSG